MKSAMRGQASTTRSLLAGDRVEQAEEVGAEKYGVGSRAILVIKVLQPCCRPADHTAVRA